jgi:hypothetical protein
VPAGSPIRPDGKCPTARYNHQPKTPEQFADTILPGVSPVWSTWQPAIKDAIDAGGQTAPADVTSTGPALQQGPSVVVGQTTNPDGTTKTTTKQDTHNYTYAGNNINVATTTTTTINNNGQVTTTTETKDPPEASPTDTALEPLPVLYTRKYPNGIVGVWEEKSTLIKATPLFSLGSSLMPSNIGATGTCPSWTLDFSAISLGIATVSPACWVWDFGGIVIVISSLLLARSLIFGG